MTTNLLIGYPQIPFLSSAPTLSTGTEDPLHPASNVILGGRAPYFAMSAAAGIVDMKFDLGSQPLSVNFLFIARANILKAQGASSLVLKSSPDNSTYTSRVGTTVLSSKALSGPTGADIIFAQGFNDDIGGIPSSAFRYWELEFGVSTPARKWMFSKAMFGTFFDFGRDPYLKSFKQENKFDAPQNREPYRTFTLSWMDVSDALRNSFIASIYQYREVMPVVLYDSGDQIFNGSKTVHATILKMEITESNTNHNQIDIDFRELV